MHGMKDDKWSKESYKRIGDAITTVEQFIGISHHLRDCLADSMFFLIRHGKGPEDEPARRRLMRPVQARRGDGERLPAGRVAPLSRAASRYHRRGCGA